jgi:hypothetical protein
MSGMAAMEDERLSSKAVAVIVGQQSEQIQQMASEYENKKAELEETDVPSGSQAHARMVVSLEKQIASQENRFAEVSIQHKKLQESYEEAQRGLQEARDYNERIALEMEKLNAMETDENRE